MTFPQPDAASRTASNGTAFHGAAGRTRLAHVVVLIVVALAATACASSDVVPGDAPDEFDDAVELAISLDRGRTDEAQLRDDMWGLAAAYCTNINAESINPSSQQAVAILAFVESNVCPAKPNTYWEDAFLALEGES